ncbi:hypothetical protein LCGC14_2094440, partial [marine sediment metagenome]
NIISKNNFTNNYRHAKDVGYGNQWDNGSIGNYWDNYTGVDTDDDGIGDSPYTYIFGSAGSQDNYPIWRDSDDIAPQITINIPNPNDLTGKKSPTFNIKITDQTLNSTWYRLWNGTILTTNSSFGYLIDTEIDQNIWNEVGNGTVTINFFANDSLGRLTYKNVTVRKDIYNPLITINKPIENELFGIKAPSADDFNITFEDPNDIDNKWYMLSNKTDNTTNHTWNGYIDQGVWDEIFNGTINIKIFANDSVGNIGFAEISVKKDIHIPEILINYPNEYQIFGSNAPNFNVEITDLELDVMWYSLNGRNNITFSSNGTIDQAEWNSLIDGIIKITFYANNTLDNKNSESVDVIKDTVSPIINIISPNPDEVFGTDAPNFIVEIIDPNLDVIWYSLNGGENITFTSNGTIDQTKWSVFSDEIITIIFYANDTLGNIDYESVDVIKDTVSPIINIISPNPDDVFGNVSPSFIVEISDPNLDTIWYTVDGGVNNYIFTDNGSINQSAWNSLPEGNVVLRFYANDSVGNIEFADVTIRKDVNAPIIAINNPQNSDVIGATAPNFDISIDELNLDKTWYSLNGGSNITFTGLIGTINQAAWNSLPEGNVDLRFYANDSVGNIEFAEVTIRKDVNAPIITINNPQNNDVIGATAPNFDISIDELNLDKTWYSLNGGINITFTGLIGTINQA